MKISVLVAPIQIEPGLILFFFRFFAASAPPLVTFCGSPVQGPESEDRFKKNKTPVSSFPSCLRPFSFYVQPKAAARGPRNPSLSRSSFRCSWSPGLGVFFPPCFPPFLLSFPPFFTQPLSERVFTVLHATTPPTSLFRSEIAVHLVARVFFMYPFSISLWVVRRPDFLPWVIHAK